MNNLIEDLAQVMKEYLDEVNEWKDKMSTLYVKGEEECYKNMIDSVDQMLKKCLRADIKGVLEDYEIDYERYKDKVEEEEIDGGGKIIGVI